MKLLRKQVVLKTLLFQSVDEMVGEEKRIFHCGLPLLLLFHEGVYIEVREADKGAVISVVLMACFSSQYTSLLMSVGGGEIVECRPVAHCCCCFYSLDSRIRARPRICKYLQ